MARKGSRSEGCRGPKHGQACTKGRTGAVALRAALETAVQLGRGVEVSRQAEMAYEIQGFATDLDQASAELCTTTHSRSIAIDARLLDPDITQRIHFQLVYTLPLSLLVCELPWSHFMEPVPSNWL
jgi:hypothetical protein